MSISPKVFNIAAIGLGIINLAIIFIPPLLLSDEQMENYVLLLWALFAATLAASLKVLIVLSNICEKKE